ncbi:hypothetical protein HN51_068607 [Arachis hypogaea]
MPTLAVVPAVGLTEGLFSHCSILRAQVAARSLKHRHPLRKRQKRSSSLPSSFFGRGIIVLRRRHLREALFAVAVFICSRGRIILRRPIFVFGRGSPVSIAASSKIVFCRWPLFLLINQP